MSRSLKNHPAISAQTRARVAEQAVRMGYRPRNARNPAEAFIGGDLVRSPSDAAPTGLVHLAVICRGSLSAASLHNAVDLRIIQGMSTAARAQRATLHIEYLPPDEFDHLHNREVWPLILQERIVSGALLVTAPSSAALHALAAHFPCVQFIASSAVIPVDRVTEDSLRSMGQLFDHLTTLGHQKIGLADFGFTAGWARARFAAYVQTVMERGPGYFPTDANYFPGDTSAGAQRAAKVAQTIEHRWRQDGVSAWICMDDYIGYLLLAALRQRGVRVPEDVSVCGFDNFDPPEGLPKLTSIDGPFEAMGAVAVRRLLRRVAHQQNELMHLMMDCRLVQGASTGPARTV